MQALSCREKLSKDGANEYGGGWRRAGGKLASTSFLLCFPAASSSFPVGCLIEATLVPDCQRRTTLEASDAGGGVGSGKRMGRAGCDSDHERAAREGRRAGGCCLLEISRDVGFNPNFHGSGSSICWPVGL